MRKMKDRVIGKMGCSDGNNRDKKRSIFWSIFWSGDYDKIVYADMHTYLTYV